MACGSTIVRMQGSVVSWVVSDMALDILRSRRVGRVCTIVFENLKQFGLWAGKREDHLSRPKEMTLGISNLLHLEISPGPNCW
jgi:hypothetical protein